MLRKLRRLFTAGKTELKPEGEHGIEVLGHRGYVGGMWEEIGKLQFEFLVKQGLKPHSCFLDIACGALRGGVHFIRYLEPGHYLGIDKELKLIETGIEQELGRSAFEDKRPEFVVSDSFEFDKFSKKPDFALAQSLFSHLHERDMRLCLSNLRAFVNPGHVFFVTFFEGDSAGNMEKSHSHATFLHSREEMETIGRECGWSPEYIGDWQHPRNQMIIRYVAR